MIKYNIIIIIIILAKYRNNDGRRLKIPREIESKKRALRCSDILEYRTKYTSCINPWSS